MGDAYVPYLVPDAEGKVSVEQLNRAIRYLAEGLNALAGRTGAVRIEDELTVAGDLTIEGNLIPGTGVEGDLNPITDDTYSLGDNDTLEPKRWQALHATDVVSLDADGEVVWNPTGNIVRSTVFNGKIRSMAAENLRLELRNDNGSFAWVNFDKQTDGLSQDITFQDGSDAQFLVNGNEVMRLDVSQRLLQQTGNGARWLRGWNSEEVTMTATTQDSTTNLLTSPGLIMAVVARITQTITQDITPPTTLQIGDTVVNGRFATASSPFNAGTTYVGILQWNTAGSASQTSDAKVRLRLAGGTGTVSGKIRVTVFYTQFVAPTS